MIGPILIAISWILLRIEKKSLVELGFNLPVKRFQEFVVGFAVAAVFAVSQYLGAAKVAGFEWIVNPHLTSQLVLNSLRWNVNSVLFEELIFRGYLLYQAIRRLGARKACLLSAAAFGVYHWFSFGAFGNPIAMLFIFLMTGIFGLMLASAFSRTNSLALPIGLHLGWNLVTIFGFSNGPIGDQLLIASAKNQSATIQGVESLALNVLLPISLPLLVLWYFKRKKHEITEDINKV